MLSFVTGFRIWARKKWKSFKSQQSWDKARRKSSGSLAGEAPVVSRCASVHKLEVQQIFDSPFDSHLFHRCHSLLCGSDNGSNHAGSVFVPHHNRSVGRMWCHKAATQTSRHICRVACTPEDAQTSWEPNGVCQTGDRKLLRVFFFPFWAVVFTPYSLSKYFTKLECIMQFQWDLLESSLLALLR